MENNVVVSVLVTTYNHEKYICKCLDSILKQQTPFHYEVIVYDDASSDSTASLIKNYENEFPGILHSILADENRVQKGNFVSPFLAKKIRGKYVALCEGDDFWIDDRKLQIQVNYLENNPDCTAVYHNCIFVDEENKEIEDPYGIYGLKPDMDYSLRKLAISNDFPGQTASLMFRSSLYKDKSDIELTKLLSLRINGDVRNQVMAISAGRIHVLPNVMSAYRVVLTSGTSWSAVNAGTNMSGRLFVANKDIKDYFRKNWEVSFPNDYKILHSGIGALIKPLFNRSSNNIQERKIVLNEFDSLPELVIYLLARFFGSIMARVFK